MTGLPTVIHPYGFGCSRRHTAGWAVGEGRRTSRLFAPDINLAEIRPKALPPRHAAWKGEISRPIMNVLRETGLALTTKDIALRVMTERGLNTSDKGLTRTVHKRIGAALRHLRAHGTVRSRMGRVPA